MVRSPERSRGGQGSDSGSSDGAGYTSNVKGVGAGVYEYRIDFGPGYRIYFGNDGDWLVILLAGGTKKRQDADISAAKGHWSDYKRRKRQEV